MALAMPTISHEAGVLADGHRLGTRGQQAPVTHGVDHGQRRGRLLGHGGQHLPLPFDPTEIAARVRLAHPDVAEGVGAVRIWQPFGRSRWLSRSLIAFGRHISIPPSASITLTKPPKPISV